jgi:hypothetical protein
MSLIVTTKGHFTCHAIQEVGALDWVQSAGQAVNELERDEGVRYWRASEHEVVQEPGGRRWVQATQNAKWKRFSPFSGYGQPPMWRHVSRLVGRTPNSWR